MMKNLLKAVFWAWFVIAVVSPVYKAEAMIIPNFDIDRLKAELSKGMEAAKQIQSEIQSNMQIVQELRNGNFLSAAGNLFGKIQNGDYDRFGKNLSIVKGSAIGAAGEYASARRQAKHMKENKNAELTKKQKKAEAAKAEAEYQKKRQKAADEKAFEKAKSKCITLRTKKYTKEGKDEIDAKMQAEAECSEMTLEQLTLENKASSSFNDAYRWLQNNRGVTSSGLEAIQSGLNGDWTNALVSTTTGVGSGFETSGNEELGALITTGGAVAGSASDIVGAGGVSDMYNSFQNTNISHQFEEAQKAYQNYGDKREEKKKGQSEGQTEGVSSAQ